MATDAVFVYADGQVGLMSLRTVLPTFRLLRKPSPLFGAGRTPQERIDESFDELALQPVRMFDGRPVYCAAGLTVQEAYVVAFIPKRADMQSRARAEQVRALNRLTRLDVQLDECQDEIPLTPDEVDAGLDLEHMQIVKICTRRLVVRRKDS